MLRVKAMLKCISDVYLIDYEVYKYYKVEIC